MTTTSWRGAFVVAPALGLALGVVARAWMRWISTAPEFTWSGTIAIAVVFVLFATANAVTDVVRHHVQSRRTAVATRVAAGVLSLGIFGAAGLVMLPTVVSGGVAVWRPVRRWVRRLLLAVAAVAPVAVGRDIVHDFGWSLATVGRLLVFVGIYSVVIWVVRPIVAPVSGGETAGTLLVGPVRLVAG